MGAQKDGISTAEQGRYADAFVAGFDAAYAKFAKPNSPKTPEHQ